MSTITHPLTPPTPRFKFSPSLVVIALLAIGLIFAISVSMSKVDSANTRTVDAQNALEQAKAQSNSLQTQVDQARAAAATMQKQLEEAKAQVTQLQAQLNEGKAREADLGKDIDIAKSSTDRLQAKYDAAVARIEQADTETRTATVALQKELDQAKADATTQREDANRAKALTAETQTKLDAAE